MIELSVNDLYEFKACPLRYKLTNIDKVAKKITPNDGVREAVKSTIAYYYEKLQDGIVLSMSDLKEKFGTIWYGKMDVYDIKFEGNSQKRAKELEAVGMLQTFHRSQKYKPDTVVATNLEFRVPFGPEFFVRGRIPLIREVARGMEIVNFKTSRSTYSEFWERTDMELTFQAMGFESIFKQESDSICVYNLSSAHTVYPQRKRSDYKRLYKSIQMIKKSIENEWYYPRESYTCDKCPAKKLCMEWS